MNFIKKGMFFQKFIVLSFLCLMLLFLIKQFHFKEGNVYYFLDIILLNFNNFEMIGFSKFTIPFIASYLIIISVICYYISQQLIKVNNTYFLIRFLSKKKYINYLLKGISLEILYFMITWLVSIIIIILYYYNAISFQIILICGITMFKILIVICIVHMINLFIIFFKEKANPSLPLLMMIGIMWMDYFFGTGMITLNSRNKYDLLYIITEGIVFIVLYFLIRKVYIEKKEIGEII